MRTWPSLLEASAPRAVVLIRFAVGIVFASEGIQKFLYADAQGAGIALGFDRWLGHGPGSSLSCARCTSADYVPVCAATILLTSIVMATRKVPRWFGGILGAIYMRPEPAVQPSSDRWATHAFSDTGPTHQCSLPR
jgi:hypothetical protein